MRISLLRLAILGIAAMAALVSWRWGGPRGGSTGVVIVVLVCGLALLPSLLVRSWVQVRPVGIGMFVVVTLSAAVGMLSAPQQVGDPGAPDDRVVVPLAHLLGGGSVTSDASAWSVVNSVAMPIALIGAVAVYGVVLLINRRTQGEGVESGSVLAVFGVPKDMFPGQPGDRVSGPTLHPPEAPPWSHRGRWTARSVVATPRSNGPVVSCFLADGRSVPGAPPRRLPRRPRRPRRRPRLATSSTCAERDRGPRPAGPR